jgi:two-component system, NarL family, nitrate/nitrite response regulator NarL
VSRGSFYLIPDTQEGKSYDGPDFDCCRGELLVYMALTNSNSRPAGAVANGSNDSPPVTGIIRILLLDEHLLVREGLRLLIERQPGLLVVGEAGCRAEAINVAQREQPDIILLDFNISEDSSADIVPELLEAAGNARVIILSGLRDPLAHRHALTLGARGLVLKQEASLILLSAIKKVNAGEVWLERAAAESLLSEMLCGSRRTRPDPEAEKINSLTHRERDVVALVTKGLKNKQVAERLFISDATVSHHLTSIFNKLGISDRAQLIVYAYRHGLIGST